MRITVDPEVSLHVSDSGGPGRPVMLLHAWGLNGRMWNSQVAALGATGYRVVTMDRRSHGWSEHAGSGFDLPTLAGDVSTVLDRLDLADVVLVGHSMGGLEAVAVAAGPSAGRLGALVLSAPMTPCLAAGPDNPVGIPAEFIAANRHAMATDFSAWITANTAGYWGAGIDRPVDTTWTQQTLWSMPIEVILATNETIMSADVRADIARIDLPTLVIQGDADASAPLPLTGEPTAALLLKRAPRCDRWGRARAIREFRRAVQRGADCLHRVFVMTVTTSRVVAVTPALGLPWWCANDNDRSAAQIVAGEAITQPTRPRHQRRCIATASEFRRNRPIKTESRTRTRDRGTSRRAVTRPQHHAARGRLRASVHERAAR
jgi:non-heme chloroperoxidase